MNTSTKIGLWILIITVVGTAALWMIGGKQGEYLSSLTIDAPPEAVFPFLVEPVHLKKWKSGLIEVAKYEKPEENDLLGPPLAQKTERIISINGKDVRFKDQVIRYDLNKSLSVQSTNAMKVSTEIFKLAPVGDKTQLSYRITVDNRGWGRILGPLQSDPTKSRIDTDIRQLKDLVEATN
ncbi:MAG: SRPBCC family protein [Mariniblastus sp.]